MARKDWERLARYVVERRDQLGLTQEEVAVSGGPSTATLRLIEKSAQDAYRAKSLRQLEDALRWAPGSVRAVLDGGEPRERDGSGSGVSSLDRLDRLEAELGVDLHRMDPSLRRTWLEFADAILTRIADRDRQEKRGA
jgi:transcriptional regulator with XRE-family HTH domain